MEIKKYIIYSNCRLLLQIVQQAPMVSKIFTMTRSVRYRTVTGVIIAGMILLSRFFSAPVHAYTCGAGKRPLYYYYDSTFTRILPRGFNKRLYVQLLQPLEDIGYCLTRYRSTVARDTGAQEELAMCLSVPYSITARTVPRDDGDVTGQGDDSLSVEVADTSARMVVTLVTVRALRSGLGRGRWNRYSPLLSLEYHSSEFSTFESVLIRKIIENLRDQYICHLRIQSTPDGATIQSKGGLEGVTPLEWIIPVGKITITGSLDGFEPIRRTIDLSAPGTHNYMLDLRKRRFYHSRFFIPTLVLGGSSVACFAVERYFYSRYEQLGRPDRYRDPDPFERNFNTAKGFERAAVVTGVLAGTSLVLCFFF